MSQDELAHLQFSRLSAILEHAHEKSAFYRERFAKAGFHPADFRSVADLIGLPLLTKDDLRQSNPFADGFTPANTLHKRTGGSTGIPVHVYMDHGAASAKLAAVERHNSWAGWRPGDRVAALWGDTERALPFRARVRNALTARAHYLDTLNLTEERLVGFIDYVSAAKPPILFGHAHSVYQLAVHADSVGKHPRFRGIVTTAMTLSREERRKIEEVFRTPVFNRYGSEEVSIIASECDQHSGFHIFAEGLFIEMPSTTSPPAPFKVIITDLLNRAMPLIRYEIGDMAVPAEGKCPCGRGLPRLAEVSGRIADFLFRPDGSRVLGISILDTFVIHIPGIKQAQIVQDALNHILVRLVISPDYSAETLACLGRTIADVFGPAMNWEAERVDRIEQTPSGKFRFSICSIPGLEHTPC